jgi:SAM-dependent methyltransferase
MPMDRQTTEIYERIAPEWCARARTSEPRRLWDWARDFFHPGEPTADVGSGSGRDVAWFNANGFPAVGFDASAAMRREAVRAYPGIDLRESALPDLADIPDASFANVWCVAVIMHVPERELTKAAANLARILRPGGRLLLSYRASRGPEAREEDDRLFTPIDPESFGRTLDGVGLSVVRREAIPETARPGVVWTVILAEKRAG